MKVRLLTLLLMLSDLSETRKVTKRNAVLIAALWLGSSLPCEAQPSSLGTVVLNTHVSGVVEAPVSLPDGTAAGLLPGMMAQFFKVTSNGLLPCEPSTTFRPAGMNPLLPFYVRTVSNVYVPETTAGTIATLRLRVWESTRGGTYEEAQLSDGYFGESNDITVKLGGGIITPANPNGLQGFTLQRIPAILLKSATRDELNIVLNEKGKAYLIEQSIDLINWWPAEVLQVSGESKVQVPKNAGAVFFRAFFLN